MTVVRYIGNRNPSEGTSELKFRGGDLVLDMGGVANLTLAEIESVEDRYILVPDSTPLPQDELFQQVEVDSEDRLYRVDGTTRSQIALDIGGGLGASDNIPLIGPPITDLSATGGTSTGGTGSGDPGPRGLPGVPIDVKSWTSGTVFTNGEGATYNGSFYLAIADSTGVNPAIDVANGDGVVGNNWRLLASKGQDGAGGGGGAAAPSDGTRPDVSVFWDPTQNLYVPASVTQGIPKHPRVVAPPRKADFTYFFDTAALAGATGSTTAASIETGGLSGGLYTGTQVIRVYGGPDQSSIKLLAPTTPATVTLTFDLGQALNFLQGPTGRCGVPGPSPSHYMRLWLQTDDERIGDRSRISAIQVTVSDTAGFTKSATMNMNASGEDGFMTQKDTWIPCCMPMHSQFQTLQGNGNVWGVNPANSPDWTAIRYVRIALTSKNPNNAAFAYSRKSVWLGAFEMVPVPPKAVFSLHFDWATHDQYVVHGLVAKYNIFPTVWIYPQIIERIAAGDPAGGPSNNMRASQLLSLQTLGWEVGLYEYWQAFIDGINNFGGPNPSTPWSLRSKASVIAAFERGQYTMAQFGLKGWDLAGGQIRKFVNVGEMTPGGAADPFPSGFDMLRRYFNYNRGPSTNAVPQCSWPPDFPMHCMQRMYSTGSGPSDPGNDAFNGWVRLQEELNRALYGHEWFTYLIHTPPNSLETILQRVVAGNNGENFTLARTGDVIEGKVS